MGHTINYAPLPSLDPSTHHWVGETLAHWLDEHAHTLDSSSTLANEVLPRLADEQLFAIGVPAELGGVVGTTFADAVDSISQVAAHSLTAAFVLWGQRTFVEYLLQTEHTDTSERYLAPVLQGSLAGATGLSNAIKFLGGIEELQVHSEQAGHDWVLNGRLPWVTNLRPNNYAVATALYAPNGTPAIAIIDHQDHDQERSTDLPLVALQGSNTAALTFHNLHLNPNERLLSLNAATFITHVRPRFLALQCAMTIGLSQRCLAQIIYHHRPVAVIRASALSYWEQLQTLRAHLLHGVAQDQFTTDSKALFRLRIKLAELAAKAVALEAANEGGVSFIAGARAHTQRRQRESLFVPLVSPTVAQLQTAIADSL